MSDDDDILLLGNLSRVSQIEHLLELGQLQRARQLAMDHIAANPDDASGHLMLAYVLLQSDHPAEALEMVEQALSRDPDNDTVHALYGEATLSLGQYADAERAIRRAIELDPSYAGHYGLYARLLSTCEYDRQALQSTEHALSLSPDDPDLHQLRAYLLIHVNPRHWTVSEEAVRTALRLDPQNANSHAILGSILLKAGRHAEAEEALREALRLDPNDTLAIIGLSELVKGSHWWYRPMLEFSLFLSRQGRDAQIGIIFALWALTNAVRAVVPPEYELTGQLIMLVYLGLCAYTWFAEPITRALLQRAYPWLR